MREQTMSAQTPLTNVQLELLKLYSFNLSDAELLDLKQVLARHFADRLTTHIDSICQEKGYTADDMERWLNEDNQ